MQTLPCRKEMMTMQDLAEDFQKIQNLYKSAALSNIHIKLTYAGTDFWEGCILRPHRLSFLTENRLFLLSFLVISRTPAVIDFLHGIR